MITLFGGWDWDRLIEALRRWRRRQGASGAAATASFAALIVAGSTSLMAAPLTINDTIDVHAFSAGSPSNCCGFNASGWGDAIQGASHPFNTDHIVFNRTDATHASIQLFTQFNGYDSIGGGKAVHYADLFIDTGTPYAPGGVSYGIALSFQGGAEGNGGFATPGLYKITNSTLTTNNGNSQVKTSQDIWNGRSGWIFGGEYAPNDDHDPAALSPTVITGGIDQNWTVAVSDTDPNGNAYVPGANAPVATSGLYTLTVLLTAPDQAAMDQIFTEFDLFWGTGDCSNDAIWGYVGDETHEAPEPSGLLVFLTGLLATERRRRRAAA